MSRMPMLIYLTDEKTKEIETVCSELQNATKYYFGDLLPSMLEDDLAVVYAIFDKTTDQTLYVGRTKKLRRRLYTNHLQGNKSTARLKKYLVEDNERFPQITNYEEAKKWIKDNCYFKYIGVSNSRERGHIEGLLGFVLDSIYIEEEH
ncbi:GIY-YIG nuclease family protein [Ruminiclostridium papyrosolvens]|uniref:GIY-YIG domain-containing protein n=1 Tax=Ruminiclostridium papyrosolvens C7 TaxID=1330534 RepID=U4QX66_9FIRM|nr:GIY-YIG nuclease family protein [Ruminiclostridium papyrosolvens]EPR08115.1 hypothetical protein L323_18490 [Ruminiclostridium papyrosolvens C7]